MKSGNERLVGKSKLSTRLLHIAVYIDKVNVISRISQYWLLTKPRVTQLAVFCAVIGMCLSTQQRIPWSTLMGSTIGIWLIASAAFAINCLVEKKIDARMRRTASRPSARGDILPMQIVLFSALLGTSGIGLLRVFTNPLTLWLTLATFVGYTVVYTMILKPSTPQNIVIGGAAGAMPPALGWAAVTGTVPADAWMLVLIIFVWTPPHFWSLALYRQQDYAQAGLPMLPITHGQKFTRLHIFLYTLILFGVSLLPFALQMSGIVYLGAAVVLGIIFIYYAWKILRRYSHALARATFRYSIIYLSLLFTALLVDHYLRLFQG